MIFHSLIALKRMIKIDFYQACFLSFRKLDWIRLSLKSRNSLKFGHARTALLRIAAQSILWMRVRSWVPGLLRSEDFLNAFEVLHAEGLCRLDVGAFPVFVPAADDAGAQRLVRVLVHRCLGGTQMGFE